jgi:hypothetical protein
MMWERLIHQVFAPRLNYSEKVQEQGVLEKCFRVFETSL